MLVEKIWHLRNRIDHEIGFRGDYGKKGEKRANKEKVTPEQIKRQNQWNKTKRLDRKIRANFSEDESLYLTLTYAKDLRPKGMEEFVRDRKAFIEELRKEYKKRDIPFKWISRSEIGKRGAAHLHLLINEIPGVNMISLAKKLWTKGRPMIKPVDDLNSGKLAEYFTKMSTDDIDGQTTWLSEKDQKAFTSYSCSRNLIIPEPEIKRSSMRTVERSVREGIKPTPGYKVVEESIIYGTNPFTGNSYLHYKEIKDNCTGALAPVPKKEVRPPWQ